MLVIAFRIIPDRIFLMWRSENHDSLYGKCIPGLKMLKLVGLQPVHDV